MAVATVNTLSSDEGFVAELKSKADKAVDDTVKATRIVDGWSDPAQNGAYLGIYADFPFE